MKNIIKKAALLFIPVVLYFGFFACFEPNNYFGFKSSAAGTAPIGRIRAFVQDPGDRLILGDSRLAHFDTELAGQASGNEWQNLAFGGASLRETLDLLEYCQSKNSGIRQVVLGLSFYTLNASYDTDRMSALQDTLQNPLAYIFNLEYNVNALTSFENYLIWQKQKAAGTTQMSWEEARQEHETADWPEEAYLMPDGSRSSWHALLRQYTETIRPVIDHWQVNEEQLDRLLESARQTAEAGIEVVIVLPPMHESVAGLCAEYGIDTGMAPVLDRLYLLQSECPGVTILDYEWQTSDFAFTLTEDQYYDGFHLDTEKGLPLWTKDLFGRI